jgi:hypothetical protein
MRVAIVRLRLEQPALGNVNFLRKQAEDDEIVTPDQACELASKLSGSVNCYLYAGGTPLAAYDGASPNECTNFSLSWVNQWAHGPKDQKVWVLPDDVKGRPYPSPGPWPQTVLLMYGRVKQLTPNAADSAMSFPGRFFCKSPFPLLTEIFLGC